MSINPDDLKVARSFLFVPANRPERINKAIATGADVVIVDLEDAVAENAKIVSRLALSTWLDANPEESVMIRINAIGTEWAEDDLQVCCHSGVVGIMLPKAEMAEAITHVYSATHKPIIAIIESLKGLDEINNIAAEEGCLRLAFGKLDLAVELDLIPDESDPEELMFLMYRYLLVLASRRADLPAPIEGVFTIIEDIDSLKMYAQRARRHGFGGQLLIHPKQVSVVMEVFTPSENDLKWAQKVLTTAQMVDGVALVDGQMIDAPVIARAQRIIQVRNTLFFK